MTESRNVCLIARSSRGVIDPQLTLRHEQMLYQHTKLTLNCLRGHVQNQYLRTVR